MEEVKAISKVPISISNSPDKLIWIHSNSGNYSIKSGYAQAVKIASRAKPIQPSSSYAPPKSMWSRLWAIPTAPKVRIFMWKIVRNWLACKNNLFRRKCSPTPLCPICEKEEESIEHILFRCAWTRAVWFGSGKSFWVLDNPIVAADRWMEDLLCGSLAKETTPEVVGAIFQLCWAIWKARNNCIFNGNLPNPEDTILKASLANKDYLQAVFSDTKEVSARPSRESRWSPPPPSVIKFNSDGAYSSSRSAAAFGIIARDSSGSAQLWRFGRVVASSAIFIEAWALRIACGVAMESNFGEVICESDCKLLIDYLNSSSAICPWEIYAIVEDIKAWASSRNWSFVWCCREKNRAAQWLASNSLSRRIPFHTGCIPPGLAILLARDLFP